MPSLKSLTQAYVRAHREYDELQAKLAKLHPPGWVEGIIVPFAGHLAARAGKDYTYRVCGPYGLGCHVDIILHKKGTHTDFILELCPGDLSRGRLNWLRTDKPQQQYPKNSLGAINRLGYEETPIPLNASAAKILAMMRKIPHVV